MSKYLGLTLTASFCNRDSRYLLTGSGRMKPLARKFLKTYPQPKLIYVGK